MRAGTENVSAIVGFGAAIRALPAASPVEARNTFLDRLEKAGFVASVPREETLGGHAHVRLPGVDAETMLIRLDRLGISASSGAACSSGSLEASHVLQACGYSEKESREGLRFTFGRCSTVEEAIEAADRVVDAAGTLRKSRAPA
jgi:cysteine desulfurase